MSSTFISLRQVHTRIHTCMRSRTVQAKAERQDLVSVSTESECSLVLFAFILFLLF